MPRHDAPRDELAALEEGRAFADLSAYRKVRVGGTDARAWLHDLVTSDVASLAPGDAQRSLLLTPTGRIRADLTVAMDAEGFVLLQAADQPDPIDGLLGKYVLSSDVWLRDVTESLPWFSPAGGPDASSADASSADASSGGVFSGGPAAALVQRGLREVGPDALEVWRIRRGVPRMGVDFGQDALPAEVGLEWTIDTTKGCFLGQESVARVRNLGHPPSVLRHLVGPSNLEAGSAVSAGGSPVGEVTSAATAPDGRTVAIVRVRWEAAGGPWVTSGGEALDEAGSTD